MSFRARITTWVVVSCTLLIGVMTFTAYTELEEELRAGRVDSNHPQMPGWTLHNSLTEQEIQDILGELMETWAWSGAIMIALSLVAGLLIARRSLRPVHDINRQLSAMQPHSLHGGILIPEADPAIEGLANHLNGLLDRAGTAYHEMAEFSARVAHELRTPLMLLRMRLEHAPPGMPPAFQEELQDELARLARFVERALLATKAEQGSLEAISARINLSELVRDVSEQYHLLAAERPVEMLVNIEPEIFLMSDSDLLRQALHGLLENAVRYAHSKVMITCAIREGRPLLEIRNDRDPATIATSGLGLGLRLVRGICKACAWDFENGTTEDEFHATMRFGAINSLAFDPDRG